jgi:hypothetical protein
MKVLGEGLREDDAHSVEDSSKTIYVLHPNCAVEELDSEVQNA